MKLQRIKNVIISGIQIDTYAILEDRVYPIIEPTMFLAHMSQKNSKESVRAYGNDLLKFFRELSEVNGTSGILGQDFRDVTDNEMNAYLNAYLRRKHGLKLKSINRHIATLRLFYDYAYSYGLMAEKKSFSFLVRSDEVKTSELEGVTKQLALEYMSKDDLKTLLDSLPTNNLFNCKRDQVALMLGYYANYRTHELVHSNNLRVRDLEELITLDERGIPSIAKPMKIYGKGNKVRYVRVWPELVQPLYEFLKMAKRIGAKHLMCRHDGTSLITEGHGTKAFRKAVTSLSLKGELSIEEAELWKQRHFHGLRKCYATNAVTYCYREGYDKRTFVTQWMGHSDYATTEVYIYFEALLNQRTLTNNEIDMRKILKGYQSKDFSE
ncbi:tyrosine-type recombinase/integrase [Marinomonas lutimaris]|uniref:tyrosine-type recombinase/integrase n=1 Tax=Marinomonas lutimaris TaxID=2846746 RepID=UPI001CA592F2|nr:site-specific integrase [Marinomonas lutimaris]